MSIINQDLHTLYGWVKRSRAVVFSYTEGLPLEVYTLERPDFAYGSIRNIHAHVAGCYLWWLEQIGMGKPLTDVDPSSLANTAVMRKYFDHVDAVVAEALETFNKPDHVFVCKHPDPNVRLTVSQRWLVMHPITHEFHHKGQMLALGRVLGHPAVFSDGHDTDLVNPQ
jgi:uncharacterized damage-inducible protein DinB